MAGWFDGYAKRSAQRSQSVHVGRTSSISRRRLIVGGSSAAAAAWTAPMLTSSPAYAAVGQSACPTGTSFCGTTTTGIPVCCDPGNACDPTGGPGGGAVCQTQLGGRCSNAGQGLCSAPLHCNSAFNANAINQCNGCDRRNRCGGEGAVCTVDIQCETGHCNNSNTGGSGLSYCRRSCVANSDCNTPQFCDQATHFCALHCTTANAGQICQNPGFCETTGAVDSANPANTSVCRYTSQN